MTPLDIETSSRDTTGYHTRSSISHQADTDDGTHVQLANGSTHNQPTHNFTSLLGQSSTNLTNHFGNMHVLNSAQSLTCEKPETSFSGLFTKHLSDETHTPSKAYISEIVEDTGLGLDRDHGSISGCDSLSDVECDHTSEDRVELDDSLIRERAWRVLGKKRVSPDHYTVSAIRPPSRTKGALDCHISNEMQGSLSSNIHIYIYKYTVSTTYLFPRILV